MSADISTTGSGRLIRTGTRPLRAISARGWPERPFLFRSQQGSVRPQTRAVVWNREIKYKLKLFVDARYVSPVPYHLFAYTVVLTDLGIIHSFPCGVKNGETRKLKTSFKLSGFLLLLLIVRST